MSAKKAGAWFERSQADYLALHVDDRIDRRPKMGAKDRGDIGGLRLCPELGGHRVVAELKNVATLSLATWLAEAETERVNDGALVGMVIHKRTGIALPGRQYVTMSTADLCAMFTGRRP